MPRESPYRIRLSRDERRPLETRSRRYTLPYREVIRARIVLLAAQGLENSVIGGCLDLPPRWACRCRAPATGFRPASRTPVLVHLPTHASWLNQIESYLSILQRKALTPADFGSQAAGETRILGFQYHYEQIAKRFVWKFTRRDLHCLREGWGSAEPASLKAAA